MSSARTRRRLLKQTNNRQKPTVVHPHSYFGAVYVLFFFLTIRVVRFPVCALFLKEKPFAVPAPHISWTSSHAVATKGPHRMKLAPHVARTVASDQLETCSKTVDVDSSRNGDLRLNGAAQQSTIQTIPARSFASLRVKSTT